MMADGHFCHILLVKKAQSPGSRGGDTDPHLLMGGVSKACLKTAIGWL